MATDHITYTIREDKPNAEMRFLIYSSAGLVPVVACRTLLVAEEVREFLEQRARVAYNFMGDSEKGAGV